MQCVCQNNLIGDPLTKCSPQLETCHGGCECDSSNRYCIKKCRKSQECACGQICYDGVCHNNCENGKCPFGQICRQNLCVDGCRTNLDCSNELSCISGKCKSPCDSANCGENSLCRVADHKGKKLII